MKHRIGYQETLADYVARFLVGFVVGLVLAFFSMVTLDMENKKMLAGIVVASGLFASLFWNPFWRFVHFVLKSH